MPTLKSRQETPVAEAEETCDILTLSRLNLHPLMSPLYQRREGLHERKRNLLQGQQQLEAVRTDFEKLHSLELAEQEPGIMQQWRDVKAQLTDYQDQVSLVEAGLVEIDQQIDDRMAEVREQVQHQLDNLFVEPIRSMIAGLQAIAKDNQRLQTLENCQHRFFSTGNLGLYGAGLNQWLYQLQRKLNLLVPQ